MKRSFHCITEDTATTPEDVKKWHIQTILKTSSKTQFVFEFHTLKKCSVHMHPGLLDVLIACNAYGLYRFIGLPSPEFDALKRAGCGGLVFDDMLRTSDFSLLGQEIWRHCLCLNVEPNELYSVSGFDYLYKLVTDWHERKTYLVFFFVPSIAELCLAYLE